MGEIESWARGVWDIRRSMPADTTPERIKANRAEIVPLVSMGKRLTMNPGLGEFLQLLNEYIRYFDNGYKSPYNIDDMPGLIDKKLKELM